MREHRAPVPCLSSETDCLLVHYPPRDEVQSRHRLQIDVDARNEDEACTLAEQIADRLLTSLTLTVPGGRYHAELRKLRRADEREEVTRWSETASFTRLNDPKLLDDHDIQRAILLTTVIEHDAIAENAYIHLLAAWQLQSTPGSKPLERAVLQHYFLCIEAVVSGTMKKLRGRLCDKIRTAERNFAKDFSEKLQRRSDKPEAIRKASTKLREIAFQNMIPSIAEVAPALELTSEDMQTAQDLYRFRSSSLSHPGKSTKKEYDRWLKRGLGVQEICLADRVSRAFLKGYCESYKNG